MRNIVKQLLMGVLFLLLVGTVVAYQLQTVYNPFTGKLDYTVTSNFSGDVLTGGNIICEGNITVDGSAYFSGDLNVSGTMAFTPATPCELVGTNCFTVQVNGSVQTCVCLIDNILNVNSSDFWDNLNNHTEIIEDGTAQGQLGFWNGSKWVHTETSELFWDDVNKRFGIGTATPLFQTHNVQTGQTGEVSSVLSTAAQWSSTIATQGAGQAYFLGRDITNNIEFIMGTSGLGVAFAGAMTAHDFVLRTNNVNRLTIKAGTGNVLIGTTTDLGSKFQVLGDIHLQADGDKMFYGASQDVSQTMNGSTFNILNEVGSIIFNIQGFLKTVFDNDVEIHGDLNVTGNITSENVFLPAYIRIANNRTQSVLVSEQWVNVTLDKKQTEVQKNIGHTWNDNTNETITINDAGLYFIHYSFSFIDSNANPDAHIGMRLLKSDGTIVKGSYSEVDTHRQDEEVFGHHGFDTILNSGDEIKVQFTSDDITVSSYLHATFGTGSIVTISIHKVSNI